MFNISYKAYQSDKNIRIHEMINISAWVWNHSLALQKRYYTLYGGYISSNRMQKHISKLRKRNPKWMLLNSQTIQEICQRLDESYKRFFKKIAKRPPKFKKAINFSSFVLKQSGWSIDGNRLIINKVGIFKFSKSREYENIKRIVVKRNRLREIYFVIVCDVKPKKYKRLRNGSIGMDFGLKTYLTLSNGEEIQSPQFFKNELAKIQKASKELSLKKKGSNNRKKALMNLSRAHIDIKNKRNDFHWKLAHKLCKYNSFIAIEDLNMSAMKQLWGRKISDLAFSDFVLKLEQIAKKYGTTIQKVGRFYPSSKTCGCGSVNKGLKLSDREWCCPECGIINQRDRLASKNILAEGIRLCRSECKTDTFSATYV